MCTVKYFFGERALVGLGLLKLEPYNGDRKGLPRGKLKAGDKCDKETEMNTWQILYFALTARQKPQQMSLDERNRATFVESGGKMAQIMLMFHFSKISQQAR